MRTKYVSFPDPAKLRSLFGPCYACAVSSIFFSRIMFRMKAHWDLPLASTKTGVNDYRGKSVLFTPGPIYPGKIVV